MSARDMGERERIIYRQEFVLRERAKGKSLDEVHAAWNEHAGDELSLRVSRKTIENDLKNGLTRKTEEMDYSAQQIRQLLALRLDNALKAPRFQTKLENGDLAAVDRLIRMTEQYAKIFGAYAPTKISQTDVTGEKDALLTEEERMERLLDLLEKAEMRRLDEDEMDGVTQETTRPDADRD